MVLGGKKTVHEGCHPKEAKVLLSTDFLEEGAPPAAQETSVELWGLLDWRRERDASELGSPLHEAMDFDDHMDDGDDLQEQLPEEGKLLSDELLAEMVVSEVAVGVGHCVLVTDCRRAFGYGCNRRGQLGLGSEVAEAACLRELPVLKSDTGDNLVVGAACGSEHTLLLARAGLDSRRQVFACGALEALGLRGCSVNQYVPVRLEIHQDVTAIAARFGASCCSVSEGESETSGHSLYLWGEVDFCPCPDLLDQPTPCFRLQRMAKKLQLGESFGLVLDVAGEVFAWGDGTYGELGGAVGEGGWPYRADKQALAVPGKVVLPRHSQDKDGDEGVKGAKEVIDIACGERHSLLLDDSGHLYAFGENLAGQCGVLEPVGSGHITGCTVQQPRPVPIEAFNPSDGASNTERGAKVFAGKWHSAMVTADHRLYIWGHPSNRKLGHVGFNHDGTEAGEDPGAKSGKVRPPGVAVRSALRDAVRRPRMVFALLHKRVRTLGLGEECTVIVHGDGLKQEEEPTMEVAGSLRPKEETEDLEAPLPVLKDPRPSQNSLLPEPPKDTRFSL